LRTEITDQAAEEEEDFDDFVETVAPVADHNNQNDEGFVKVVEATVVKATPDDSEKLIEGDDSFDEPVVNHPVEEVEDEGFDDFAEAEDSTHVSEPPAESNAPQI
jgi:hypothetical protein